MNPTVETLSQLSQDGWNQFIRNLSYDDFKALPVSIESVGDNLASRLSWVSGVLSKENPALLRLLNEAVIKNLATILPQENNAEILKVLIHFVYKNKPLAHRESILHLIRTRNLNNVYYGSDNLQHLLIYSYIELEDREKMWLEEDVLELTRVGNDFYHLYLQVYYYASLGKRSMALRKLALMLVNDKQMPPGYYEILKHILLDCVPQYIKFSELLKFLVEEKVSIHLSDSLTAIFNSVIAYWEKDTPEELTALRFFIEDFFNCSESNANKYPRIFKALIDRMEDLKPIFSSYYGSRDYNLGKVENIDDIIATAMAGF